MKNKNLNKVIHALIYRKKVNNEKNLSELHSILEKLVKIDTL